MIPTQKKLTYGSKKALKFRGASLLKIVTVEYSEDAGWEGKVKMRRKRSCKPGKFRLKREMSLSLRVSGLDLVIVLVVLKILDHFLTM